jgi:hypothetical protein
VIVAVAVAAFAGEPVDAPSADLHGHFKQFFTAGFPYDSPLFPAGPYGTGVLAARLRLEATAGPLRFVAHHELIAQTAAAPSALQDALGVDAAGSVGFSTGVGAAAPQAVDLSWAGPDGTLALGGTTDRLLLGGRFGPVDATIGRQPISFGTGRAFTPLDLVNPFTPTTIDTEYKPGVDAVRVDAYPGSARVTLAAAYAGAWDLDGLVIAATGSFTVGVTDLLLLVGEVHADEVVGVGVETSAGAFGVHGDASFTAPAAAAEDPFVRAVLGTEWYAAPEWSVGAEVYVQTFGATDPAGRLDVLSTERAARGEIWLGGPAYASVSLSGRPRPLIGANVAVIGNLTDPSALLTGGASFSVSDDAEVSVGALVGVGSRPTAGSVDAIVAALLADPTAAAGALGLRSELGLVPATAYARVAVWF